MQKLIHLTAPYSDESPEVRLYRVVEVAKIASRVSLKGTHVICPMLERHLMTVYGTTQDTGWTARQVETINVLTRCEELWIVVLEGWEKSIGVRAETIAALELKMPIKLINNNLTLVQPTIRTISLSLGIAGPTDIDKIITTIKGNNNENNN